MRNLPDIRPPQFAVIARIAFALLMLLSLSFLQSRQYREALEHLDIAIFLDPTLTEAHNFRGTMYSRLGQVRRAVEDFSEAIRLDPAFEAAYANRALAHAVLGEEEEMQRDVEAAVSLGYDRAALETDIKRAKEQR